MGKLGIAFALLAYTRVWHWPKTILFFGGVLARRLTGLRLFRELVLEVDGIRLSASLDGHSGLVFFYEVCLQRTYEAAPTHESAETALLFDVGANCGFLALSRCLRSPHLRACCFEPHPATSTILRRNIALNGLEHRIIAVQAAVGSRSGKCSLNLDPESSMGVVTTSRHGDNAEKASVEVNLVSLDDFAAARGLWPDAIKIDVEGFEKEVLIGAGKCLARTRHVVLEYHTPQLREECLAILQNAGFQTQTVGSLIFGNRDVS